MTSRTSKRFRHAFRKLPQQIQRQAREAYRLFKKNPYHPSLSFKRIHSHDSIYSVRINISYRAVGVIKDEDIIWFWIGSHADYDRLLKKI